LVGVGLVWLTDWTRLDPHRGVRGGREHHRDGIRPSGVQARASSTSPLPEEENARLTEILGATHRGDPVPRPADPRSRAGERYANVHVLVPDDGRAGGPTSSRASSAGDAEAVPGLVVLSHLEPIRSRPYYEDIPDGHVEI
jgi:hypothetical protein